MIAEPDIVEEAGDLGIGLAAFGAADDQLGQCRQLGKIDRVGGYPLFEFTSSPLTSGTFDPPGEKDNADVVPGTYVVKRQFGMIRVTGPGNDRTVALESYDQKGELQWRHEIRARDLQFRR